LTRPTPRPVLLGIDGRSGAGKTSLAAALAQDLTASMGLEVTVFHVEDVYRGWTGLRAGVDHYVHDVLVPLRRGEPARWHAWDWVADAVDPAEHVTRPSDVVVCEGVGAACAAARPLLDGALTLVMPAVARKRRALARDGETYRPYWDVWAEQEEEFARTEPAPTAPPGPQEVTVHLADGTTPGALRRRAVDWAQRTIASRA
jgi:para-aminobenzoate synthetase